MATIALTRDQNGYYVEIALPEVEAQVCVSNAVVQSAWFEVTPLPDGLWRIRMKREHHNAMFLKKWEG